MKMFLNSIFLQGLLFVLVLSGCSGVRNQRALGSAVKNGDFEIAGSGLTGWTLDARHADEDRPGQATGEPEASVVSEAHSGNQSLHIFWDIPDEDSWRSRWTLTNETVYPVSPGDLLTVRAWMRGKTGFRCGKVWLEVIGLADMELVEVGIGKDMLNARSQWKPMEAITVVPEGCNQIQIRFTGGHRTDLFLDDVEVFSGHPEPTEKSSKPLVEGSAPERKWEKLDRGLIALTTGKEEVYIGWRLLESDSGNAAFNVYRSTGSESPVRLNDEPITATTDFVDRDPIKNEAADYFVRSVMNGLEGTASKNANFHNKVDDDSYISIKLKGNYGASRAGVGDLDGDGQYEYIIKTPDISYDPWAGDGTPGSGGWRPSPGTYKLEAFRLDGTMMWEYDLGWSIELGVWFSPFVVYDLDGDGRAEVALKAGEGDHRQADGHVSSGPEYLMILDGETGKEITRTDWIPREGFVTNEALNRNQLCVAYLDGKTPCIIAERGTYDVVELRAYTFEGGKLRQLWQWNDREEGGLSYTGQGAHTVHGVDLDDDGRDEVVIGSAVVDDNGQGLWTNADMLMPISSGFYGYNSGSGRGHPDRCVIGELDPLRPGLEMYLCLEPGMYRNGVCMLDARNGDLLWGIDEESEHGHYGLIADIDPDEPGVEIWAGDERLDKFWTFTAQGKLLGREKNISRIAAFWNADLQREYMDQATECLVDYTSRQKWTGKLPAVPLIVADVLGDWREELVLTVPGELRIYTTTIPAADRRLSLMRDPIYRLCVAEESQAYLSLPAFKVNPH